MSPEERVVAGLKCSDVLVRLSDYVDGQIAHADREQIDQHLRGCNWCEQFGGRFSGIVTALRRELAAPDALPDDVADRLRAVLDKRG